MSKKVKIGFDFMCVGEEHHSYHIGLLVNKFLDEIYLDTSCNFTSHYRDRLIDKNSRIHFARKKKLWLVFFYFLLLKRKSKISIVGVNSKFVILLLIFRIISFRQIELHLHGQIVGINNKWKRFFWFLLSKGIDLVVANPIYSGPNFIKSIGNLGSFVFLVKKNPSNTCMLYGSNKEYLNSPEIRDRILSAGVKVSSLIAEGENKVSTNSIINLARDCRYSFLALDEGHYRLSPSGRICDLRILGLTPLVLREDFGSQRVLRDYGQEFVLI